MTGVDWTVAVAPSDEASAASPFGDSAHPLANPTTKKMTTVGHRLWCRMHSPGSLRLCDLTPLRTRAAAARAVCPTRTFGRIRSGSVGIILGPVRGKLRRRHNRPTDQRTVTRLRAK